MRTSIDSYCVTKPVSNNHSMSHFKLVNSRNCYKFQFTFRLVKLMPCYSNMRFCHIHSSSSIKHFIERAHYVMHVCPSLSLNFRLCKAKPHTTTNSNSPNFSNPFSTRLDVFIHFNAWEWAYNCEHVTENIH